MRAIYLDKRLLILQRMTENGVFTLEELSNFTKVSVRHMSRLLKHWADKEYIEVGSPLNKGKNLNIKMNIDADSKILEDFIDNKENMTVAEIEEYLSLPWKPRETQMIQNLLLKDIKRLDDSIYKSIMIDYIYRIPKVLKPNLAADFYEVHCLHQIVDSLYKINDEGDYEYCLVYYDEWNGEELTIYLKKDIYFSDGQELSAEIVKNSLERLQNEGPHMLSYAHIKNITVHDKYSLTITVTRFKALIKYQLSLIESAIFYSDENCTPIGTGPYRITKKTNNSIILKVNLNSFRGIPDIRKVYLLKDQSNIQKYYERNQLDTHIINCQVGMSMIVFNPIKSRFNRRERGFLTDIIKSVMHEEVKSRNYINVSLDESVTPTLTDDMFVNNNKTVTILVNKIHSKQMEIVKSRLKEVGIHLDYVSISNEEEIHSKLTDYEVDLTIINEHISLTEPMILIYLMMLSKFKDWYRRVDHFKNFDFNSIDESEVRGITTYFLNHLFEENQLSYIYHVYRQILIPDGFKAAPKPCDTILYYDTIITDPEIQ